MASTTMLAEMSGNVGGSHCKQMFCDITPTYATRPDDLPDGAVHPWLSPREELSARWNPTMSTQVYQVLPQDEDDVAVQERNFKDAMLEYERTAKPKYRTGIRPDDLHTVQDLEAVVTSAVAKLQPDDSRRTLWKTVRLACRKLAECKDNIDGWLGLLPDESVYLSVVCGGLKLVLSAAARFHQVKGRILEALVEIPTILNGAKRVLRLYRDSAHLVALSKVFYTTILSALGHILYFLQRHAVSKALQVLLQPASFQRELLRKIDAILAAREAFNREADLCAKEMVGRLEVATQKGNMAVMEAIRYSLYVAQSESQRANLAIQERWDAFEQGQGQIYDQLLDIREEQKRQSISLELFQKLLQGGGEVLRLLTDQRRLPVDTRRKQPALPVALKKSEPLRPDLRAIEADILAGCRLGPLLAHDDQERSVYMARSPQLSSWLTATDSAMLLVNGYASSVRRQSASTFVCARLAAAFEQIRADNRTDLVPLTFFCGEHVENGGGLVGVVQGLLAQLLARCPDLDVGPLEHCRDLHKAWRQFVTVLRQLPEDTTVLCMVDGLSWYLDNTETEDDAEYLVQKLLELAHASSASHKSKKPACAVKLLLTAANRLHSRKAEALDDEEVLNVPTRLARTGGFVEMKWHMDVEQQLERLQ